MVASSVGLYLSGNREINMMMITTKYYPLSQNEPTLASCRFDKHGLILTIFIKHHK